MYKEITFEGDYNSLRGVYPCEYYVEYEQSYTLDSMGEGNSERDYNFDIKYVYVKIYYTENKNEYVEIKDYKKYKDLDNLYEILQALENNVDKYND